MLAGLTPGGIPCDRRGWGLPGEQGAALRCSPRGLGASGAGPRVSGEPASHARSGIGAFRLRLVFLPNNAVPSAMTAIFGPAGPVRRCAAPKECRTPS